MRGKGMVDVLERVKGHNARLEEGMLRWMRRFATKHCVLARKCHANKGHH